MKKTTFFAVVGAMSLFLNTSCKKEEAPAEAAFDMTAAKAEIETAYLDFEKAFNAKDAAALANCYTTDAKFMQPNDKTAEGREKIQGLFAEWFKTDMPQIDCKLIELWGNADNLTAENQWVMTLGGKVVDEGKSIEVYKKEDGKWKMMRDCYNSDNPPMPMAPPAPPAPVSK